MRDLDIGGVIVPGSRLRATTSRSGGPGGQNVNKVESRVTIEVDLADLPLSPEQRLQVASRLATRISGAGVLRVTSQAERSQLANRDLALARLEELLRAALIVQPPRRKKKVTRAQKARRLESKKRRSDLKRMRSSRE